MASVHGPGRAITASETEELLNINKTKIDAKLLKDLFAVTVKHPTPRFNTWDTMVVPERRFPGNKTKGNINTTVGRYIFNVLCVPNVYIQEYGFVNTELSKKGMGSIEQNMAKLIAEDTMTFDEYSECLNAMEWLGFNISRWICPGYGLSVNKPLESVKKRKAELIREHAAELENNDATTVDRIEKELIDIAVKEMDATKNEEFDYYRSGARGSIGNNYKNTSIMRGMVHDLSTGNMEFIASDYFDGLSKTDAPKCFNTTIESGYSRGVATASTGYEAKKLNNAMQTLNIDEDHTDCGTPFTLDIVLEKEFADMFYYRYIVERDGSLTLLTPDNIGKYVGGTIRLRSPMYCKGEKICNICAGDMVRTTGVRNSAASSQLVSSNLSSLQMKRFHDSSIKMKEFSIYDYIEKV